jgi:hypothetical protein
MAKINGKTPEMWAIAHGLLNVAPEQNFLSLPSDTHTADFIPLSARIGKSPQNKNAVSVHSAFVSFMVPDWSVDSEVRDAGFVTKQTTEIGNRLHVFGLNPEHIKNNGELFQKLVITAKAESEDRQQTRGNKGHR